ncbi:MAG TPA: DUF4424 family protein [Rhizomicrobium sp.]|nr:DUF4424 family protein [Rhizomicrobium sp.]
MRAFFCAGVACAALLFASEVAADDSSAALGMGGIEFTQSAEIRMTDEDLRISPKDVHIRFVFKNESARDIDTVVAFPLPDINTAEFSNSPIGTVTNDPVNFVGFQVRQDGHAVPVSVEQRAFLGDRDVTATIKSVGLPINIIIGRGYDLLVALPPAKRKILTAGDLAEFDSNNNALPHWTVRTRFYWRQHFPAGKSVVFEQSYQPVTGISLFGDLDLKENSEGSNYYTKGFCLDAAARATLARLIAAARKKNPNAGGYLNVMTTEYILKTGNNWKGPIGRFHLTLDKLRPDNVLSLCWGGTLKRTGPATFEDVRSDFAPKDDVKLLVFTSQPPPQ